MDCAKTRKSTGAYAFFLWGSCIAWASKKQGLIALSSTEAEFIAGTEAAKELSWIIEFMQYLIYFDGEAAFSYAMAYVVAVLEVLVVVNIVVGWVMLGRNGVRSRGVGRAVVVQVKKA